MLILGDIVKLSLFRSKPASYEHQYTKCADHQSHNKHAGLNPRVTAGHAIYINRSFRVRNERQAPKSENPADENKANANNTPSAVEKLPVCFPPV